MKASVHWINRYLDPGDLSPDQVEDLLTNAGFPIDQREPLPAPHAGDERLEVEVTSNRGDCLSHIGLAREIAAKTGRILKLPALHEPGTSGSVRDVLTLENTVPDACPRFTAQVVRGVKVGPSPQWLSRALEAVGQRSINNIVDATNFVNFEFGQPTHAFDLAKLGGRIVIRSAHEGEALTTLDGKRRTLKSGEIVVADAARAQSLAGIIGGGESEVSAATIDVVLEVATWDPVSIRRTARRHQVRTDASHRYERIVDPRTLDAPAQRLASLILEVAGGTLLGGMLDEGPAPPPLREITLRTRRCRGLLAMDIPDEEIIQLLRALHIESTARGSVGQEPGIQLVCTIPAFRPDLEREIDLIEEVARVRGLDALPTEERISVAVRGPQTQELAAREAGAVLTGLGFFETVTFSFVSDAAAKPFLPPGLGLVRVDDERRRHEAALRPSLLPSLLACRKANQDRGAPRGLRLFEAASVYAEEIDQGAPPLPRGEGGAATMERRMLALLMDVPGVGKGKAGSTEERQAGVRLLRGAVEALCMALGGGGAEIELRPSAPAVAAFDPGAHADVLLGGRRIGRLGIIAPATQRQFDLDVPQVAAELELDPLLVLYPPRSRVGLLPEFPGIERDVSLVVDERTPWADVRKLVESAGLDRLEEVGFVGSYRGRQIGEGKKSLTLRLRFRDPSRTLRHEEVDPQVASAVALAAERLGAIVRA